MTRVLQIRRGTSAQHENFVGMPGELTMDTDNKTIRLHDGVTLGGITVGDCGSNSGTEFDINSVPDEFWADIVARHTTQPFTIIETEPTTINTRASGLDYIVGGDLQPKFIQTVLVCLVPQAGYNIGDEVWCWGIGNFANPNPTPIHDNDGLHIRLMINKQKFWVNNKNTGEQTEITNTNWAVLFRVYC